MQRRGFWVREDNVTQDLVIVKDVAEEDCYRVDDIAQPDPVVVDIGAHIGCFSKRVHDQRPQARIVAVECCPENLAALRKNVGHFASVVQAAVTYEPDVALLNAVYAGCRSTGGCTIVGRAELDRRLAAGEVTRQPGPDMLSEYWADLRPLHTLTLEQLMREQALEWIDVLKLDCEGSEFSILRGTQSLDRIGMIVGEYHGKEQFLELVRERFDDWTLEIWRDGDLGLFQLVNPEATRPAAPSAGVKMARLVLDGEVMPLGPDYCLRWVQRPGEAARPALYCRGKRVKRPWRLDLSAEQPSVGHSRNGKTPRRTDAVAIPFKRRSANDGT